MPNKPPQQKSKIQKDTSEILPKNLQTETGEDIEDTEDEVDSDVDADEIGKDKA